MHTMLAQPGFEGGKAIWKDVLALSCNYIEPIAMKSGVTGFCLEPPVSAPAPLYPVTFN